MTTKVNERALVLEMLLAVNEEGQYSHLVLRDVLDKYQYLGKQERAFLTRLMEGTLERQLTLDYVIDQFSKTRVKKMKPLIRNLMRSSGKSSGCRSISSNTWTACRIPRSATRR